MAQPLKGVSRVAEVRHQRRLSVVRITSRYAQSYHGRLAQLGERLPYKQEVAGSSPAPPTQPTRSLSGFFAWARVFGETNCRRSLATLRRGSAPFRAQSAAFRRAVWPQPCPRDETACCSVARSVASSLTSSWASASAHRRHRRGEPGFVVDAGHRAPLARDRNARCPASQHARTLRTHPSLLRLLTSTNTMPMTAPTKPHRTTMPK